jgi:hypothetical protein
VEILVITELETAIALSNAHSTEIMLHKASILSAALYECGTRNSVGHTAAVENGHLKTRDRDGIIRLRYVLGRCHKDETQVTLIKDPIQLRTLIFALRIIGFLLPE